LHQPATGLGGRRTPYQWIKSILLGSYGHLGEIEALKAMQGRAQALIDRVLDHVKKSGT
jgi:hypothetical protein